MDKSEFYANARSDLRGPMDGVVVIEATTTWAGPMAGCILADFGASVIKVEHPEGEICRLLPPRLPNSKLTVPHETVNRSKQNVSLDLKTPQGRDIFLELCKGADIIIENFKPATLAGWGVGYDDVAAVKPDIIYVSISAFGQFGPYCDRPGYDPIAQNFCGWTSINGEPEGGPIKAPTFLGDDLGGIHGALGALAALQHRNSTGEGQHVDVALVDGLMFQSNGHLTSGALNIPIPRFANQFAIAAPVNVYECADGYIYGGVLLDRHWEAMCDLFERDDLKQLKSLERLEQRKKVDEVVANWCISRTTTEVIDSFNDVGLAVTRVNTYAEASETDHVRDRDMLQSVRLADGNTVPLTGPAAKFSRTPTKVHHAAPVLGQDNSEIFGTLGYTKEDLKRLRKAGVI